MGPVTGTGSRLRKEGLEMVRKHGKSNQLQGQTTMKYASEGGQYNSLQGNDREGSAGEAFSRKKSNLSWKMI